MTFIIIFSIFIWIATILCASDAEPIGTAFFGLFLVALSMAIGALLEADSRDKYLVKIGLAEWVQVVEEDGNVTQKFEYILPKKEETDEE